MLNTRMFALFLSSLLFWAIASAAHALTIHFDDLDASGGDIDLTGSGYQGYVWSNFSAYISLAGLEEFNHGIVSPDNAAYGGGETFGSNTSEPLLSTLSANSLFDFATAYFNAVYYDNLDVFVEGLLNNRVLFSKTVTISTASNLLVDFDFTGINRLNFWAVQTESTVNPFGCAGFNCTQFTLDSLSIQDSSIHATVPEPPVLTLLFFGMMLWCNLGLDATISLIKQIRRLSLILVIGCFTQQLQAGANELNSSLQAKLTHLSATQFEEPLIATTSTSIEEDAALLSAIELYQHRSSDDDYHALTDFLSAHSESGWQVALLTNLGLSYYQAGRFSLAIDAWEKAWRLGKSVRKPRAKVLVDRTFGELMRMHARIGHADRLVALFAEMGDRVVTGPATEAVAGAREGLWMMQHEPGIAYLCGPMALKNLLLSQGATPKQVQFLNDYRSGTHGVSLTEVGQLAEKANLSYTLIQRDPDQPVPVPSVVHWKVSHYAAIIGEHQGRYHIQDPIFGEDLWVTRDAIDAEASGYFLVPTKKLQAGWRSIQLAEADILHGMGYIGNNMLGSTTPQDDKSKPSECNFGMCGYNFTEMVVSLNLNDTPVGYTPPKGPAIYTTLTYNQREASQPANFSFFNVSQKWSINWLSYIQDSPSVPGANVSRYVAGGGSVNYSGYNSSTGQFARETRDQSILIRTSANPIRYEHRLPNGSIEVYAQSSGASVAPRRVFLTQLIDAAGNAVTLNYDSQLRLTSITDATGRDTAFAYELTSQPLLVTKITDPFGRYAQLSYDTSGRLVSITDVLGLQSSFHYNKASLIDSMTTPYGTSRFAFGESGIYRWLEATDPLGYKERLEYRQYAPGIAFSDPASTVPQGIIAPFNSFQDGRNSFYWDKLAYQLGAGDYTKARIKHWTHWVANTNVAGNPVESIKFPLENRIWFNYPGQPKSGLGTAVSGTFDKPTRIGRVLDDGTTQLTQISYNSLGNPTHMIDPLGRDTQIDYAANQIDVVRVSQKTAASTYSTIAELTYNNQHLPLTSKDAANQTTSYRYNSSGQLIAVKDPLNQVSDYEYDQLGYLTKVTNANGKTELSLAYDTWGRVASKTDSEGHTLSYSYDNFDRITQVTYPDGTFQTASWDKLDLASITDRQGRTTKYIYDAVRNLIASIDPLNRKTQYDYYPNQTLKNLIDAKGQITTWNRDLQSRVTAKVYADGQQETNSYESTTSRLKTLTDSLGQSKRYTYAKDNRFTKLEYLNAINATPAVSLSYDAWFPRLTAMTDGSGATQYQYQALGLPGALSLKQTDGPYLNDTIGYQYDALGRITNRNVDSSSESFEYDALNRVVTHNNPLGSFKQNYLGETGQLTSLQHSNGRVSTNWSYDDNTHDRHLLNIQNSGATRSYDYETTTENLISQIHEISTGNRARPSKEWSYAYDTVDRLETVQASDGAQYNYEYDAGDNLLTIVTPTATTDITANSLNQVTDTNGVAYSYDANGNLKDDGIRTYQWDADNRLLKIDYKAQPSRNTQFRYDGLGRRVAIISKNGTMTTENRYLWCGDSLCQSRTAADVVNWRSYPQGEIRPLGNTLLYFSRDHLGSVRDVLTVQGGVRIATYDYDAYGKPTYAVGRLSTNFRYAGMFYLQEAGIYLTQYRAYDPNTGRWLSRDPIGESGGVNLYGYVGGNPVNAIDPDGRVPIVGIGLRLLAIFMPMIDLQMMAVDDVPGGSFSRGCEVVKDSLPSIGGVIRQFEQSGDKVYYRVFSGNASIGGWLTAIPPRSSAWAQDALALPPGNMATMIQEVLVPNGTLLERSRAIPMLEWGRLRGGAEQFKLIDEIPRQSFGAGRPLK